METGTKGQAEEVQGFKVRHFKIATWAGSESDEADPNLQTLLKA